MSRRTKTRAVFLDRDGVISRSLMIGGKGYAPRDLRDFRLLPGAADAIRKLRQAGYLAIVVTNQPDIGNGKVSPEVVDEMHRRLQRRAPVDAIFMCPHGQKAGCRCRKPKPGMLIDAARRFKIDLKRSWMVGDRWSDVAAGEAAGCKTIRIDRRYAEDRDHPINADFEVRSVVAAAKRILRRSR